MSNYSRSQDATDFLEDYKGKIKSDPRLEFHQDVIKDFGEQYERAYMLLNTYYAEAYKDLSYYLGNQWSLEELAYLNNQRRSSFTYNKIRRLINLVQGYQRKNRLATIISPIEDASEGTAGLFTDTMQYVMQHANGYEAISDAFKGALTTGISFLSPYMDYRNDPVSGDIKFHLDEWNAVIFDPFFTKRNLEDCTFIARRKYLSRTDLTSLFPEKEDVIMSLPWGTRDDKFTYMPYARQWGMQKLMNTTEYWRTRWKTKEVLVDMATGETREWKGTRQRLRMVNQMLRDQGHAPLELMRKPVREVEKAVIVEGELIDYEINPYGYNDYPFVPFFAIFEPSYDLYTWKIQSLVRIVRDPQTELNKRRSKMVDIIDSQLNTGWIAKTNSVSNPTSLYKSGQGQVVFLKPEAQMSDVQRLNAPDIPQGQFALEAEFEKDIMEIAGVNSELFGMAENDKVETAGVLSKMRQSAGLVNLQDLFDGLRNSQKLLGEKCLALIQLNYTPEKIKLITKKDPTPEFYSGSFSRYDVVVEEGVLTDTQRQTQFTQLLALKQMGLLPPEGDALIIKNSSLHNKKELQEAVESTQKQAQAVQQAQMQQQMEQQAVVTHSLNAKADSDHALAQERIAKISTDHAMNVERLERAEQERNAGILNLVKALKELEGMDVKLLADRIHLLKEISGASELEPAQQTSQPVQEPTDLDFG